MKKLVFLSFLLCSIYTTKAQCHASVSCVGALNESIQNDGTISNSVQIKITGNVFTQPVSTNNYQLGTSYLINNVPVGLIPLLTRVNDTTVTLSFLGAALSHTNINNVSISLQLLPIALQNNILPGQCQVLLINNTISSITFLN